MLYLGFSLSGDRPCCRGAGLWGNCRSIRGHRANSVLHFSRTAARLTRVAFCARSTVTLSRQVPRLGSSTQAPKIQPPKGFHGPISHGVPSGLRFQVQWMHCVRVTRHLVGI